MPLVSRARVHVHSPVPRHLDRDMGCCAKSVKSQFFSWRDLAQLQAAIADNSSAQEWRRLLVRKSFRYRVDKSFRRYDSFRVASIHAVPGKLRRIAKIFFSAVAIFT